MFKFSGEKPRQSVISIKLPCNFIEIALRHECSSVNLLHIFRTFFLKNPSGWRLLMNQKCYKAMYLWCTFIECWSQLLTFIWWIQTPDTKVTNYFWIFWTLRQTHPYCKFTIKKMKWQLRKTFVNRYTEKGGYIDRYKAFLR